MPHLCSLPTGANKSSLPPLPPTANIFERLWRLFRLCTLVHPLNPRCKLYFRSSGAVAMERKRHIKSKYLYIIHPFSIFRIVWEIWMLMVFIFSLIFLPLDVVLDLEEYPFSGFSPLVCTLDCACLVDIFVTFFTGYGNEENKEVILEPKKIARNYVLSPFFILDVCSSIPSEIVSYMITNIQNESKTAASKYLKCFSLCKIVRLRTTLVYLSRAGDLFGINQFMIRIIRYVILTAFAIHWVGCIHYIIPVYAIFIGMKRTYKEWIYADNTFESSFTIYINCVFRSTAFLLGVERKYNLAETLEMLIGIFTFIVGFVLRSLLFVLLLQMVLSKNSPETKYQQIMNEIVQYMRHKKLPIALQKRLVQYYDYRFQKSYFKESAILATLSNIIVREINLHTYRKLVKNVFILVNLPHNMVGEILQSLILEVFLPNDVIVKAGTNGDSMYFLASGTVCVLTPSGKEVCHLEEGAYFGEIALVSKDQKRTADVVAIEICQVYRLDRKAFVTCIASHNEVYERLEYLANVRREQTRLIEELHKKYIMERLTAKNAEQ